MEGSDRGYETGEVRGYQIEPGADLRGAHLQGADLSRADLLSADLGGANLEGANLQGAQLFHTSLIGANLRRANLEEANLIGDSGPMWLGKNALGGDEVMGHMSANLRGADLTEANLKRAKFGEVEMDGGNFSRVDFGGAHLGRGSARSACFASANFKGASFGGLSILKSDFRGAYLRGADLKNSVIKDSDFTGADLEDAVLPLHLGGCDFTAANLRNAKLISINSLPHIVEGGVGIYLEPRSKPDGWAPGLSGFDLGNKFRDANLEGARMEFACLFWTDFTGANLSGASLIGAMAHEYTTWPDGFDYSSVGLEEYVPRHEDLSTKVGQRDRFRCASCGYTNFEAYGSEGGGSFQGWKDPTYMVFKVPYPADKAKHMQDVHSRYQQDTRSVEGDLVASNPDEIETLCLDCFVEKRRSQLGL